MHRHNIITARDNKHGLDSFTCSLDALCILYVYGVIVQHSDIFSKLNKKRKNASTKYLVS